MRLHRFYIEQPLGEELVVEQKELVHQWSTVFRLRDGDKVVLFSPTSTGFDHTYQILSIGKDRILLDFISKQENILPDGNISLCMAIVKKDTFETVVRHATELGVSSVVPILATRSEKKNLNMTRLRAIATEAAEQCGRGDVPEILPIENFKEALGKRGRDRNVFASLLGTPPSDHKFARDESVNVWIGPEGGWTDEEENIGKYAGMEFLKLTPTVLKADTAAVTALSTIILS